MQIILIDNYDSFTWNLAHLIASSLNSDLPKVIRNDAVSADDILLMKPDIIFISPGPKKPEDAGISLETVKKAAKLSIPVFGVCLGFQIIGNALGGKTVKAPEPIHGKTEIIKHNNDNLFSGIPENFKAVRYHSLMLERETFPKDLQETATSNDGKIIMALKHKTLPMAGVLFHPESFASAGGKKIIRNFVTGIAKN